MQHRTWLESFAIHLRSVIQILRSKVGGKCERQPQHSGKLRAEAAVGKAGIKMLFPIVIFILPVLFVITLVPGMLSVLHDLKMLGGGGAGGFR